MHVRGGSLYSLYQDFTIPKKVIKPFHLTNIPDYLMNEVFSLNHNINEVDTLHLFQLSLRIPIRAQSLLLFAPFLFS